MGHITKTFSDITFETTFIYGLTDPITDHIRYVGVSVDPINRTFGYKNGWNRCHIKEALKNKYYATHKINWIKNLLKNNLLPNVIIIDEVPKNNWQFWEKHYIKLYREYEKAWGYELTNSTDGGDGWQKGTKMNIEGRMKISLYSKNRTINHKNNLSNSLKGKKKN